MQATTPGTKRLQQNNKHSSKISWYRRNAVDMVNAIDDHLLDRAGIKLPAYWQEFKVKREDLMQYDAYGSALDDQYGQLVKMRYDLLKSGRAVYAYFEKENSPAKTQIMATWYSKHRLDPVWNYRKSQLIRKIYGEYLKKSNIHNEYHPVHMVLTVPHKDGLFEGERFYASQIMENFNLIRKSSQWKKYVYAGEYGVEVKKSSRDNGLHIHIHCLVFQHKQYRVKEAAAAIHKLWQNQTGANFLHYETLYYYKKNEAGRYITELVSVFDREKNDYINVARRKKFYLDRADRPDDGPERLAEYLFGVMECIKYHFKHDSMILPKNQGYDVELMADVLNNTKGKRLYSRFGAFYDVQELNFNRLEKEHISDDPSKLQTDVEIEDEIMATTSGVEENLIDPHTGELAKEGSYKIVISRPEWLKHRTKNDPQAYEPVIYNATDFLECHPGLALKVILQGLFRCKLDEILTGKSFEKYQRARMNPEQLKGRQMKINHNKQN